MGAHCLRLERRRCGPFDIGEAITLEDFEAALAKGTHGRLIYDLEVVLGHLPGLVIRRERAEKACRGVPVRYQDIERPLADFKKGDQFRVLTPEMGLVALAKALVGLADLPLKGAKDPLFKIEKVLVEEQKVKSYNYSIM